MSSRSSLKTPTAEMVTDEDSEPRVRLRMANGRDKQLLTADQAGKLGQRLIRLSNLLKVKEVMES